MNDMKNSFPFVNEGGIMIVDDYERGLPLVEVEARTF